LSTPVLIALLGPGRDDLTTAARRAVEHLGGGWTDPWSWDQQPAPAPGGSLRGLFAGGTLCDEAMLIASEGALKTHGLTPRARIHHLSVRADDPVMMLSAPIPATAYALQKTGMTPDDIKNNPALQGVSLPPRLGQPGRTFIGTLTTKTLVIAGEGGVHRNEAGERVALLRAYDKVTGADIGAVEMPDKQTGSPMTYMINGKQYIVVAVSGVDGAQLIAYALP